MNEVWNRVYFRLRKPNWLLLKRFFDSHQNYSIPKNQWEYFTSNIYLRNTSIVRRVYIITFFIYWNNSAFCQVFWIDYAIKNIVEYCAQVRAHKTLSIYEKVCYNILKVCTLVSFHVWCALRNFFSFLKLFIYFKNVLGNLWLISDNLSSLLYHTLTFICNLFIPASALRSAIQVKRRCFYITHSDIYFSTTNFKGIVSNNIRYAIKTVVYTIIARKSIYYKSSKTCRLLSTFCNKLSLQSTCHRILLI